ncbi:MAG: hypothetical protein R2752_07285 [Vicinamibacterales bacterium]
MTGKAIPAVVLALGLVSARQAPEKALIQPSDFAYLGYYDVQTSGEDTTYSQGLTHRYVDGDLRLLIYQLHDRLHEISLKDVPFGARITQTTGDWPVTNCGFIGLWFEEAKDRLWTTCSEDYFADYQPAEIRLLRLGAGGTTTLLAGPNGLRGITQKRVYGGCRDLPAWMQQMSNLSQPYVCGWGGYTSLVSSGGVASMGLTMYAVPDPTTWKGETRDFKTLADHESGTTEGDGGAGRSFDRGWRLTPALNYYDGGDPRPNPPTPPEDPPRRGAGWLHPLKDGHNRFVWGDSYYNTGNWVETATKRGFVAVASLCGGKCYYSHSTLNSDERIAELHVFDPAQLAEVARGRRRPWQVQPVAMERLDLPGEVWSGSHQGNWTPGNAAAATFDAKTGRFYLARFAVDTFTTRIYVYQVGG